MTENVGATHPVGMVQGNILEHLAGAMDAQPPATPYLLSDYVEWIVAHKGCGKPLTGSSPKNGFCMCSPITGEPPVVKQEEPAAPSSSHIEDLKKRCEKAEAEVAKLLEKLKKASEKIAELIKKQGGDP